MEYNLYTDVHDRQRQGPYGTHMYVAKGMLDPEDELLYRDIELPEWKGRRPPIQVPVVDEVGYVHHLLARKAWLILWRDPNIEPELYSSLEAVEERFTGSGIYISPPGRAPLYRRREPQYQQQYINVFL